MNDGFAIKMGVYAALVYDIVAATNSSPQTTEINASVRGDTLMKWVHLGLLQSAAFVLLGAAVEPNNRAAPLVGGGLAGALLLVQYRHALNSGLESGEPGTEVPGGFG